MLGKKENEEKKSVLTETDLDSFDSGKLFETFLSAKDKGKVLNRPNKKYTFPEDTPLLGVFVEKKEIDDKGNKFNIFIFEQIPTGDYVSLTGAKLEQLIPGRLYIIDKPIIKHANGKKFNDYGITDLTDTEEFKMYQKQKKG